MKKNCVRNLEKKGSVIFRSFAGCSNRIRLDKGIITSPGYTRIPYPNSKRCIYTVELPDNNSEQPAAFAINSFDVAEDDRLMVCFYF